MSRIGNLPIEIPQGVSIDIDGDNLVTVKGPKGELKQKVNPDIRIKMEEGQITERPSESRIREAVDVNNVEALVVACPKDVTMYQDAVKTTGYENKLQVKDLIELVHEAM